MSVIHCECEDTRHLIAQCPAYSSTELPFRLLLKLKRDDGGTTQRYLQICKNCYLNGHMAEAETV